MHVGSRKLLLTKKELDKLQRGSKDPGFTIIPVRMFINEKGLAKVVVGSVRVRSNTTSARL